MTLYESPIADDRCIWDLWLGSLSGSAMVVALDLGIFAVLAQAPATAAELAQRLELNRRGTVAVLRLLAANRLLAMRGGRYQLTATAQTYLLADSGFSFAGALSARSGRPDAPPQDVQLRQRLCEVVEVPPTEVRGDGRPSDNWSSGQIDLDLARRIAAFMHSHSMGAAVGAARNNAFTGVNRLLDVGGGSGCFAIALAQRHPHMRCTIMDLPAMCTVAQSYIADGAVEDRVDTVAVDMFRMAWPTGYDALLFSNVFHDWSFGTCAELAAKAYAALPSGGRIVLHEQLLDDDGNGPVTTAAFSLLMFLGTKGQQFTYRELADLLEDAGFADVAAHHSFAYYSLVTARKP